jgi:hypothetical protein
MWSHGDNGQKLRQEDFNGIHRQFWNKKLKEGKLPVELQKPIHLLAPTFGPPQYQIPHSRVPNAICAYELFFENKVITCYIETINKSEVHPSLSPTDVIKISSQRCFMALNLSPENASVGTLTFIQPTQMHIIFTIVYAGTDSPFRLTPQEREEHHRILWNLRYQLGELSHIPQELQLTYEQLYEKAMGHSPQGLQKLQPELGEPYGEEIVKRELKHNTRE